MIIRGLYTVMILLFFVACKSESDKEPIKMWTKEQSADFNKNLTIEEELAIKIFLANKTNWTTIKTGSGLRYYIYDKTSGEQAKSGMIAGVKYKINLLDGTFCYETEANEIQSFQIDKSEVESGVQEGIKKMRLGEKAKLIIPSHLGHGLVGDFDKIPPLTTIIIDIELVNLK